MKKSKFTDSQIMEALKRAEAGVAVPEICREFGISTATFYNCPINSRQTIFVMSFAIDGRSNKSTDVLFYSRILGLRHVLRRKEQRIMRNRSKSGR